VQHAQRRGGGAIDSKRVRDFIRGDAGVMQDMGIDGPEHFREFAIDHVWPRRFGGANHPSNLAVVPTRVNCGWRDRLAGKAALLGPPPLMVAVLHHVEAGGCGQWRCHLPEVRGPILQLMREIVEAAAAAGSAHGSGGGLREGAGRMVVASAFAVDAGPGAGSSVSALMADVRAYVRFPGANIATRM
jgi:hypothetical protein